MKGGNKKPSEFLEQYKKIDKNTVKLLGLDVDNMSVLGFITNLTTLDNLKYEDDKFSTILDNENEKKKAELIDKIIQKNNKEFENNLDHPLINLIIDSWLSQRANGVESLQIYINSVAFNDAEGSVIQAIMDPIINKAREKFKEITNGNSLPSCDLIVPGTNLGSKMLSYMGDDVVVSDSNVIGNEYKTSAEANVIEYIKTLPDFENKNIASILVDNDPKHYEEFAKQESENNITHYAMPITRLLPVEVKDGFLDKKSGQFAESGAPCKYQEFEDEKLLLQNFDPNTVLYNAKGELNEYGKDLNVVLTDSKKVYLEAIGSEVKLEIDGRENLNKSQSKIPFEDKLSRSQVSVVNVEAPKELDKLENLNLSEHSNERNDDEEFDLLNREGTKSVIIPGSRRKSNEMNTSRIMSAGGDGNNGLNNKYQPPLPEIAETESEYESSVEIRVIKETTKVVDQERERLAKFSNELSQYIKYKQLSWWKKFLLRFFVLKPGYDATSKKDTADDLKIKIKSQLLKIHCLKNGLGKDEIDSNINDIEFKSRTIEDLMRQYDINQKDLGIEVDKKKRIKSSIADCYEMNGEQNIGIKYGKNIYVPYECDVRDSKKTKKLSQDLTYKTTGTVKGSHAYL